jgi:hypothetical protein
VRNVIVVLGFVATVVAAAGLAPAQTPAPPPPPTVDSNPVGAPGQPAAAASVCVNLAEAACVGTAGCSWLPGYKIATGEVPGLCRPAPKPLTRRPPSPLEQVR